LYRWDKPEDISDTAGDFPFFIGNNPAIFLMLQDLLPAADRSRRVLAYELLMANGALRNLIRENQLHQLENTIQMGRKEGMMLMDNCLYDLYCKCQISYDTAVSRARSPDRIIRQKI
jgi:twitching motility protein PilT